MTTSDTSAVNVSLASAGESLTLGIEIEFILIWDEKDAAQVCGFACHSPVELIITALKRATPPIPIYRYSGWDSSLDFNVRNGYEKWTVEQENLRFNDEEFELVPNGYEEHGIELKSRCYSLQEDWEIEITHTLQVLMDQFNNPSNGLGFRIFVPQNCGLHVHVGMGSKSYPVRTVKNLMQLTTGLERVIDELHSTDRFDDRAIWCVPMSRWLLEAKSGIYDDRTENLEYSGEDGLFEEREDLHPHPLEWCKHIDRSIKSLKDLEAFWSQHGMAYNLENLIRHRYKRYVDGNITNEPLRTIEFRQHRGCIDAVEIVAWIHAVTSMVNYADKAGNSRAVLQLIEKHIHDNSFDALTFLRAVGVQETVVQYYDQESVPDKVEDDGEWRGISRSVAKQRNRNKEKRQVMGQIRRRLEIGEYGTYDSGQLDELLKKYAAYPSKESGVLPRSW